MREDQAHRHFQYNIDDGWAFQDLSFDTAQQGAYTTPAIGRF